MGVIVKLGRIFDRNTITKLIALLAAIIVGALLETLALSIISPFISILLDNGIIETNIYVSAAYYFLGFTAVNPFLALLTFLLAGVYIFRGVYLYFVSKVQFRFIARRQATLSARLLQKILGFSYLYHTGKNIAELQRIIILDVQRMFEMITALLYLATDFFMTLFMMVFLFIVSPVMTLCVLVMALSCVLLYIKKYRKRISNAGEVSRNAQIGMYKSVNQALGGIKEVKQLRRESFFTSVFVKCSDLFVDAFTQYRTYEALPRLVIESVCFGGTFIIIGVLILAETDIAALVPQLSLFVLAAFRILPAVSRQVNYLSNVIHSRSSIDAVYKSLFEENDPKPEDIPLTSFSALSKEDIVINNVSFQYPNTSSHVLENVSLTIPAQKTVAFIGPSGVGKTTLADLILGILAPSTGGVYYDGKSVHHGFEEWSDHIGYIPQQIYLLDESIRENVAFGIALHKVDESKVWRALEQAQIADFVRALPDGLDTIIGDRGIRLSGGQRQRLGIARAMYEDPPVLILDEATSSLDNETEQAVMDAVMGFQGNKTMIIVAHRLSTIEHCDIVYRIERCSVVRER